SPVDLHEIRYLRPRARKNPACDLPLASLSHDFTARADHRLRGFRESLGPTFMDTPYFFII
ncbi:MAG: hypothetical protein JW841_18755, partial [Deltaproteobacteria bacterium]|nr:hypothetical protein [Deltaproteobacteria bacterium]